MKKVIEVKLYRKHWLFRLPILKNFSAITLGNRVFLKEYEITYKILAHEAIHVLQQKRDGFMTFLCNYITWFFYNLLKFKNWNEAYMYIPYEAEAYKNERLSYFGIEELFENKWKIEYKNFDYLETKSRSFYE